ncbi:hypothetical protein QTP70_004566 [Hemibagrus guttatus]|uniref:Reverse transcriptase domain-containing protein n=1 Tax=Hemibagrus guttatus TaxID=175788 RepID=A0AAE0VCQ8_9TELE|nr:hypothetical protein QTP70_004566 [Hemibagrus guttatus]
MDTLLSVFPSDSTPLTVLGDFNLPSDKLHSSGLLALLNSFSLSFNSCLPTHKEGNVLDLVFTHPSPATDMTVTPLHISDHHLVSFSITLPVLPKRNPQHLSLTRRNLHSISPSSVASYTLSSLPDHESFSSLPLDSATDTLLSSLSSTMDFLCPLSTIRRKNSSPAPWLSDVLRNNRRELRSAARKWKKSKLDTDLTSYRTLLSKFSLDVTSAKTSFYKEKLETSAQDPRKLHNIFSSLLNPPAPPSPSSLTAEDFASFYTEKIERICQTFTSLPTSPTSHNQHSTTPSLTQLSTVAAEEVLQITRSCNPTTCPLDPIPSAMLQTISPDLLPFITTVINGSLTSGHVPTAFKKARVIPILKKPALDPSDISNYRPVSLLSFLSKILERVVCNQLSDYLMQNNLHDPNQSGFKAAHSTETALLAVTEKLHAARSAKLSSVLILLDLSAAFDTVNHKTLLSTLRSLGICGTAWEWFASYLDGRSYQVTWKGLTSAPRRLSTGVPQGSVLGPLLFSLYTHSLGKVISSHGFSYHCYADDTQLIFSFPPSDTTASARISACLADISSWMTAHQLKLNPSKTELLIIPGTAGQFPARPGEGAGRANLGTANGHAVLAEELNLFFAHFDVEPLETATVQPMVHSTFTLTLEEHKVRHTLWEVNTGKKAEGPDGIPGCVLKDQLAGVFTRIFNQSLSQSTVPPCLKSSTIIFLPKKPRISSVNDYQPVTLTPVVMKCFKKLV